MSTDFDIAFRLSAELTSTFKGAMAEANQSFKNLEKFGKKAGQVGKSLTKGLTLPIVGVAAASIKTVAGFDDAMSKVVSISGATGKEFDDLREKAKELGRTTAHSASDAADGMGILASTGAKTADILSMTGDVLNLASASGLGLEQSASILTNTMGQFGLKAKDAEMISNQLVKAANSSKTSVDGMGEAMTYAGTAAANMNMDVAQTSAMLGIFANVGIEGSAAGTTFTAMASDLSKQAKNGAIAIGETSVAVYDSAGKMKDMGTIMADVGEATKGMSDEQRNSALQAVFGQQSIRGVNAALSEGAEKYKELENAIYKSDNAAKTAAFLREDNLAGAFRAVGSAVEGFMIDVGDIIKGPVQKIAMGIVKLAGVFGNLSEPMKKVIVVAAGVAASIGPVLLVFSKVVSSFVAIKRSLKIASAGIKIFGGAFKGMAGGMLTNPIFLAVAAIVALGAAFVIAYKKSESFRAVVNNAFANIKTAIGEIGATVMPILMETFQKVMPVIMSVVQKVMPIVTEAISSIIPIIITLAEKVFPVILSAVQSVFPVILAVIQTVLPIVINLLVSIVPIILQLAQTIIPIILSAVQMVFPIVLQIIQAVMPVVINLLTTIIPIILELVQMAIPLILSVVEMVFPIVLSIIQAVIPVITTVLGVLVSVLQNIVIPAINAIMAVVEIVFPYIQMVIQNALAIVNGIIQVAMALLKGDWEGAWNAIKETASTIMDNIISFFQSINLFEVGKKIITGLIDGIKSMGSAVIGAISGMIPEPIRGAASKLLGKIPGFAEGGIISSPTLAWVGEGGDTETVIPWNNSQRSKDLWTQTGEAIGMIGNSEDQTQIASNPNVQEMITNSKVINMTEYINNKDQTLPKFNAGNKPREMRNAISPEKITPQKGGGQTIIYVTNSPQYHISGGDQKKVQDTVENSNDDLLRRIKELQDDDRRLAFG